MDIKLSPQQRENLRPENWQTLSTAERLDTLKALETSLAAEEGRSPSNVVALEPEHCRSQEEWAHTRGAYYPGEITDDGIRQSGTIAVNSGLLEDSQQPYMATETLYHEARHAHQRHIADHPELAESSEQAHLTEMNIERGYLTPNEDSYELYTMQPVERDAVLTARERTDELFSDQLQSPEGYAEYKNLREDEIATQEARAERMLGPKYEDVAKETVIEKHNMAMEYEQLQGPEPDRDRDYYHGHGY